jgi:hypothetical protein
VALEPMRVELTPFERLEILRNEQSTLAKELDGIERRLQSALDAQAKAAYLSALSPYFAERAVKEQAANPAAIEKERQLIHNALEAVNKQIPAVEGEIQPGSVPAARSSQRPAQAPRQFGGPDAARKRLQGFGKI